VLAIPPKRYDKALVTWLTEPELTALLAAPDRATCAVRRGHHQHRGQARERQARRQQAGQRSDQPARLVEGQRVMGQREALNELGARLPWPPAMR
jgi:hypothetical protein